MKVVVIDAGHGGKDNGATGNGLKEKDVNLSIALKLGKLLSSVGVKVIYTRTTDVFIELSERANIANRVNADVFISIHANAHNGSSNGVEVFSFPGSKGGMELSKDVLSQLVSDGIFKINRGNKTANFAVLRRTKMTSILTETGFIDHKGDAEIIRNKQSEIANSIYKGVVKYLGIKTSTPPKVNKPNNTVSSEVKSGKIKINVNGRSQEVTGAILKGVSYIYIGEVLIPVREAYESLGLKVDWNEEKKTIIIK